MQATPSTERWWVAVLGEGWTPRRWIRLWWNSQGRPMPFVFALACLLALRMDPTIDLTPANPELAVAEALAGRGLACAAADVTWVDGARGVTGAIRGGARALVRAS